MPEVRKTVESWVPHQSHLLMLYMYVVFVPVKKREICYSLLHFVISRNPIPLPFLYSLIIWKKESFKTIFYSSIQPLWNCASYIKQHSFHTTPLSIYSNHMLLPCWVCILTGCPESVNISWWEDTTWQAQMQHSVQSSIQSQKGVS